MDYCDVCHRETSFQDEKIERFFCSVGCQYNYYVQENENVLIGLRYVVKLKKKILAGNLTFNDILKNIDKNISIIKSDYINADVIIHYLNSFSDKFEDLNYSNKNNNVNDGYTIEDNPFVNLYVEMIGILYNYRAKTKTNDLKPLNFTFLKLAIASETNFSSINPYIKNLSRSLEKIKYYDRSEIQTVKKKSVPDDKKLTMNNSETVIQKRLNSALQKIQKKNIPTSPIYTKNYIDTVQAKNAIESLINILKQELKFLETEYKNITSLYESEIDEIKKMEQYLKGSSDQEKLKELQKQKDIHVKLQKFLKDPFSKNIQEYKNVLDIVEYILKYHISNNVNFQYLKSSEEKFPIIIFNNYIIDNLDSNTIGSVNNLLTEKVN